MKRETLNRKARIRYVAVLILFSTALFVVAPPQAQGYNQEVKTAALAPIGVTMSPIRSRWTVAQEASGYWGIIGEMVIKNTSASTVSIKLARLSVVSSNDSVIAEALYKKRKQFAEMLMVVYQKTSGEVALRPAGTSSLEPGDTAFLLLASAAEKTHTPAEAKVQVRFKDGSSLSNEVELTTFDAGQRMQWPLQFSGGNWLALNTASGFGEHRKAIFPVDDEFFISQRFAIDTVQIDARNRTSNPPNSPRKEDYFAFGEAIMSTGEGTVVAVVKDQPDQEIGAADAENPGGNYIVIQHAPHLYSFYAHMQRDSAQVEVGESVSAGQLLGRVGNSGSSSEPHLHIHFMDNWDGLSPVLSLFTSQGVPALFWNAKVIRGPQTYLLNGTSPIDFDVITNP
ncbi:MAG: M23 family metallopeptidase [Acidobacteria bacterium]|nr:M23 family metallopeptidase [Acidobacteriota bacterium]